MASPKPAYPATRQAPETVTFAAGVSFTDPYRWLEEDSPEALAWQAEQDALTQGWLKALPTYGAFTRKVQSFNAGHETGVPKYAGGRWFRQYAPEGQDLAVVEVGDQPEGPGRRVIDLNAMRRNQPLQLDFFRPSPDGSKAVISINQGGHEAGRLQVIDVETGALLLDGVPHARVFWTAWLPDSSGFYYTGYDAAASMTQIQLYFHRLGEAPPTRAEEVELTHPVAWPVVSADGRHVLIVCDHLCPRPEYIRAIGEDGPWRPLLRGVPDMVRGALMGDEMIAITDDGAPRGRLVAIPLATATDRKTWRELVAASDNLLGTVLAIGDRIVLMDLVDCYSRIRVLDRDGRIEREIALPGRGVVNTFGGVYALYCMVDAMAPGGPDEIAFLYNSPVQGPTLCLANVATGAVRQLGAPAATLDAVVTDGGALSADGRRIPYRLVARRDLDPTTPRPTILFGYGGFNAVVLPGWLGAMFAAWVQAGGNLVMGHLRGGGEFGPEWWSEGRLKLKQNTFNDLYAIAEDLIARGVTTPGMLGVNGGSNGGTMASAAVAQRPDLFRASVPQVPITDVLGRRRDPVSMASTLDYGDPDDPEMIATLAAWSPYQNLRDGVAYPAVLVDSGENDSRCPAWHGRKFAARLQAASSSDRPILLRVRAGAGHGAVGAAAQIGQQAEVLSFFADQLGLQAD